MTDRLHDHLTLGFRRGCVACAQVEADMRISQKAWEEKFIPLTNTNPESAHPEGGSGAVRISASA